MTKRQLLTMCANNVAECDDGVPVWLPNEKACAVAAERSGEVTIDKDPKHGRFGGYAEWRVRLVRQSVGFFDPARKAVGT